jgi:phospholipid N-methyltransferase
MHDALRFLRHWIADPAYLGTAAPSASALATLITREINGRSGRVVELGAGSGAFTQALRARGVREANLVLVERNPTLEARLRARFPHARVLRMDAARLGDWTRGELPYAGAVVSSLPLLTLPAQHVHTILRSAFACLDRDGAFYQLSYAPVCPVPRRLLAELGLEATHLGSVWRNLPPAAVYRLRRRAAAAVAA